MTWLLDTPTTVVQACLTMLPRLEAEESQLAATRTAVGSGTAGEESSTLQRQWAAQAFPEPVRRPVPKPDALIGRGFMVRRVPKVRT